MVDFATEPELAYSAENMAKNMAKQIEKDLGKNARRAFHDAKDLGDRTARELKDDAMDIYREAGKQPPKWM